MVLDAEVNGKAHGPQHGLPRLRPLLEPLPLEQRPAPIQGDDAFRNERVMAEIEDLDQAYLFKLRQTTGVARLTEHAGQSRLLLTLTHAAGDQIKAMRQYPQWSRPCSGYCASVAEKGTWRALFRQTSPRSSVRNQADVRYLLRYPQPLPV